MLANQPILGRSLRVSCWEGGSGGGGAQGPRSLRAPPGSPPSRACCRRGASPGQSLARPPGGHSSLHHPAPHLKPNAAPANYLPAEPDTESSRPVPNCPPHTHGESVLLPSLPVGPWCTSPLTPPPRPLSGSSSLRSPAQPGMQPLWHPAVPPPSPRPWEALRPLHLGSRCSHCPPLP